MYISDFVWLFDIIEKLLVKHSVTQFEVEEVFGNRPRIRFVQRGDRRGKGHEQVGKEILWNRAIASG